MFQVRAPRLCLLLAGLGLAISEPGSNKLELPTKPEEQGAPAVKIFNGNASARLVETTKGNWALSVSSAKRQAMLEASPPKEGVNVEFGEKLSLPNTNIEVGLVKMPNDKWYVVATGGQRVGVTEAQGVYSADLTASLSETGARTAATNVVSHTFTMQDGHRYHLVAGGRQINIRPGNL